MRLSSNPGIIFEPVPNIPRGVPRSWTSEYSEDGKMSNSLGFRDREHSLAKDPGVSRGLILGDSVTTGLWINEDRLIFSELLTTILQKSHPVEILNFSVPGYNTQQEVETLAEKGLQYQPDIVLLNYCLNDDHTDNGDIDNILLAKEKEQTINKTLSSHKVPRIALKSSLFRFIWYRALRNSDEKVDDNQADQDVPKKPEMTQLEAFSYLSKLSIDHQFRVVVVILPHLENLTDYLYLDEHKRISDIAKSHGFKVIDLLEDFRKCEQSDLSPLGIDQFHLTPNGHRCAAESVARELNSANIL